MRKVPKLRFKEFSDEWEEIKEEIKILSGNAYPLESYNLEGILLVQGLNIYPGKLIIENPIYISKDFNNFKHIDINNGDILLGLNRPIINNELKVCLFENDKAYLYQRAGILQFNRSKINTRFLYQYLRSKFFKRKLEKELVGSDQPYIKSDLFKIIKILSGKFTEQEKIANFLFSIDKKISLTEEKLKLFREYKKGVMQKIFSQELRFKDSDDNDYPEWEEKKLEEVAECLDNLRKPLNSNEREKIKGSIPYYGANGIQGYINNYIFNEELVLLAEDGGNFDDYLTKPIAQYVQGKSWINNHAHVLKGKKVLKTKFLYFSLVHKDIRSFINGTSRSKLNKSSMLNIIILLPALEEQEKIADFLSSIDSKIENIEKELEGLKEFKKGLLQQMFV